MNMLQSSWTCLVFKNIVHDTKHNRNNCSDACANRRNFFTLSKTETETLTYTMISRKGKGLVVHYVIISSKPLIHCHVAQAVRTVPQSHCLFSPDSSQPFDGDSGHITNIFK